jgi:hypothetical protein
MLHIRVIYAGVRALCWHRINLEAAKGKYTCTARCCLTPVFLTVLCSWCSSQRFLATSYFTTYVAPPYTSSVSQTGESLSLNSSCSCITVEKHYSRNSLKQDTQSGLRWPGAWVDLVKAMMRSSICSALHIFLLCKKRRIRCNQWSRR